MARPDQEAIDTFMSIIGVSEATAIQKLEEKPARYAPRPEVQHGTVFTPKGMPRRSTVI